MNEPEQDEKVGKVRKMEGLKGMLHPYARKTAAQVRRHRVWLFGLLGLFVLFGLLGYFWLPGYAKGKLEEALSAKLHRPVTIQQIEISPYTLEATVRGFRIGTAAGDGALLKFDSLYVNLSSMSIVHAAPVISAITLSGPQITLSRDANGRLSIADLIEEFSKRPAAEGGKSYFSVSNIRIENGRLDFDDGLKHVHEHVSDINLGLPFVANFPSSAEIWVQPHLSARINGGALVDLQGKAHPFTDKHEAVLDLKLDGLDLTGIEAYAPIPADIKLHAATFDSRLAVRFISSNAQSAAIRIDGDVGLRNLDVESKASLPWRLNGEHIVLHLKDFDPMLKQPLVAAMEGTNLRFRQGDKPEVTINTLRLDDVHADLAAHKAAFSLAATVNGKGGLKTTGNVAWAPLTADLAVKADQVDIVALQGFVITRPFVLATKGALSFNGTVKASGEPLNVAVKGDGRINDFNLLDKTNENDLLRWRSLDLAGIDLTTAPLNVKIHSITESDFFARLTIMPDGTLRLRDVIEPGSAQPIDSGEIKAIAHQEKEKETTAAAATTAPASVVPQTTTQGDKVASASTPAVIPEKAPLPIHIDELVLKNGSVIYTDRFIKPNYRANLSQLNGKIGPLSPGQRGQIAIKGMVNRNAPLDVEGKVDPFSKSLYLDLTAKAKGIDMPGFSPYSSRYLGYTIEKGKLSVELHYYIENSALHAQNHIFLDQFTLGQKVDSPDAISVPLSLAVSLLKDSDGNIDIDLPVTGSLNDPEFSLSGLVLKVFVNLIVKAVVSPFALLGSAFSNGADLSHIEFAPGYAQLTPETEKSLEAIAKAMAARPALKVEITGVANAKSDPDSLKHALLERRAKAQKLAEMAHQGQSGGSISTVEMSQAEYPKYLELAYKAEKFDKPRNFIGMTKSLPVTEMEQLMLEHITVGDDELRALAERRARTAQKALLDKGAPAERLFMVQPRVETTASGKPGGRVDFSLH